MPREGTLVIHDVIRGDVAVEWAREQDHVVQRADGSFLYHLANVVDDHDFQITHVIRAEEHLSNTPRQIFIAQSLGYDLPIYAHLPFVAEPGSKTKLSKRKLDKYLKNADFAALMKHGRKVADALEMEVDQNTFNPVVVDFYEQVGYLPEAIINYLALLGLGIGRPDGAFQPRGVDRAFFPGAGEQGGRQLRSQEALGVPGLAHAAVAAGREGRAGRAVFAASWACRRRRDPCTTRASQDRACRPRGGRPHQDRRRHPRLRLFLRCRRQAGVRRKGRRQIAAEARRGRTSGQVSRDDWPPRNHSRPSRWNR